MTRKEFYKSKLWKYVRIAKCIEQHCVCERCGQAVYVAGITDAHVPRENRVKGIVHHKEYLTDANFMTNIAVDQANLELLCIDCHNREHFNKSTRKSLMFDENGNIVPVKATTSH